MPPALGIVRAIGTSVLTVEVYLGLGGGTFNGVYITCAGTYFVGDPVYVVFRTQDPASGVVVGSLSVTGFGAWTNLSFGTGWADFAGGYQTGQYRKIGDMVYLRGLCKRTAGVGTTIATLPTGHRPPLTSLNQVEATGGLGRIDIYTTGELNLTAGTATYVSLSDIPPFSITA